MAFDPVTDYPLGSRRPDLVRTPTGRALDEVTLAAAREGTLTAADTRATAETLGLQAQVARAAGRRQLADGLERAAELDQRRRRRAARDLHRPPTGTLDGARSSRRWAARLDDLGATRNAAFVREAAGVYADRSLLARG